MTETKEIENLEDIQLMVDSFYGRIRQDEMLGPVFNNVIQDKWPAHLEKMYRFWETVLLDKHSYYGAPFVPHAKLPVQKEHFDRWIDLFSATVDTFFHGEKAERAKWQGNRMAEMFLMKIQYHRNSSSIPLI
ncbi:MAG TPA: group III truncated hemoglobin [Saprospiraceae bacterium]|jgi:hemoglobin|nr:group III truncated hemoglobin [Saprospiraceae bacterium]MCC6688457.1 group III truncated hemoglobin [Saprospiraceae bacterium]HMV23885.1 group III truncated hemoglobin [Saprospiraceae bacterium]HMW74553.1 group III truncated hemoglobin [Saprospiraceae bacterium]HMX82355.1 group III truncated hemoglobin [Saprospiraceae bacterium]